MSNYSLESWQYGMILKESFDTLSEAVVAGIDGIYENSNSPKSISADGKILWNSNKESLFAFAERNKIEVE